MFLELPLSIIYHNPQLAIADATKMTSSALSIVRTQTTTESLKPLTECTEIFLMPLEPCGVLDCSEGDASKGDQSAGETQAQIPVVVQNQ